MKNTLDRLSSIQEKILYNIDLLEVAKNYCDCNFDKSSSFSALATILNIVLNEQKYIADSLDEIV